MSARQITLRGVEVHNLKKVDLDIPHQKLVVFCGVSGSGKTSLALDTLYAEGQRRYIESLSAYTRQFLERLEKPAAERIEGIPPAIAVTHQNTSRSGRATVGTATETSDYLQLLFAKIGHVVCRGCGHEVRQDTPQSVAKLLATLSDGVRYMIAFPLTVAADDDPQEVATTIREDGFVRAVVGERIVSLDVEPLDLPPSQGDAAEGIVHVVVDRLTAGGQSEPRIGDSLETAFAKGDGQCNLFVMAPEGSADTAPFPAADPSSGAAGPARQQVVDARRWWQLAFSADWTCADCQIDYPTPEPRLYSFNSPLGACPVCEGFGSVIDLDMDLVVPDSKKSLREGAIALWNTPAYQHELEELLELAGDYHLPIDVPFDELTDEHLKIIREGVPERDFGGIKGFIAWLERRKYKMHLRVFLSRWRSYRPCPECGQLRLRPEALATQVGGKNIAQISRMKIQDALVFLDALELSPWEAAVGRTMLAEVRSRLGYLDAVGLGYLALDRTLRTLSGGEAQRVALTSALGSSLVNMLYVLDEPSVGLHPRDVDRLLVAIEGLRDRGNTVVVVEHEAAILRAADQLVEIGPGAGELGGRVTFQGSPAQMRNCRSSLSGDYLAGRRGTSTPTRRRPSHGWIRLDGARGNNLKNLSVEFPLGVLCLVTGVSGSGKSTLVQDTLYPALRRRMRKDVGKPYPHDDLYGDGQLDEVILVDQSPIGRSPRSNPVTYIKAFDEIRAVFAETIQARTHNYKAGHFSFNVDGGRCSACRGDGYIQIDMQFLADVYMKCGQCGGNRFRKEILDVTYRGRNIAEVLQTTVREAFTLFRGRPKVLAKLKRLMDVGLDYLRLGQPANTLSVGEAQRLKLASYMSSVRRGRSLLILDEPTTGLHFSDIVKLLDCFEALLSVGHSLVVVEHNLQIMKAADYIIDLGPGAAEEGGQVVVQGTPEQIVRHADSITGRFLAETLAEARRERSA